MSIHSSIRPNSKHRNQRRRTSQLNQCHENDGIANTSSQAAETVSCGEPKQTVQQHESFTNNLAYSITTNGVDNEDSLHASISPSMVGDSLSNSNLHRTEPPGHQFSQYVPVCLYIFHRDTFPRNWCLKMISDPYPFHIV